MTEFSAHTLSADEVAERIGSDLTSGLTALEAQNRLQTHGTNELREEPPPTLLQMLWEQFNNFVVILLIVAAIISAIVGAYTGEGYTDALAIVAIVPLRFAWPCAPPLLLLLGVILVLLLLLLLGGVVGARVGALLHGRVQALFIGAQCPAKRPHRAQCPGMMAQIIIGAQCAATMAQIDPSSTASITLISDGLDHGVHVCSPGLGPT